MTAKTFFNKGIYLSTIRRFWIGSALYMLMLFMAMNIFGFGNTHSYAMRMNRYNAFFSSMRGASALFAVAVPVVVAMIIYKFVHSKKNSVFTHSLPVTRKAVYISTVAAAFTLMAIPVIITGFVMLCYTRQIIPCVRWVLYSLYSLFTMFGFSTFAAFLTGSSWAVLVLCILMHSFGAILGLQIEAVMQKFAFGYDKYGASVAGVLNGFSMPMLISNLSYGDLNKTTILIMIITIAVAAALYVAAYFLYKNRKMEKCEDVAAFKFLNPVFKFIITTILVFMGFSAYSYTDRLKFGSVVTMIILSLIGYFGMEMLLKKKINIWKESYKGYIAYVLVICAFFAFMAGTTIFGFETYVPDVEDVKYVAINDQDYYYHAPPVKISDPDVIEVITKKHQEILDAKPNDSINPTQSTGVRIIYTLKNGRTISRWYAMSANKSSDIFAELYEHESVKKNIEQIFSITEENVSDIWCNDTHFTKKEQSELLEVIKADVENNGYKELYYPNNLAVLHVSYWSWSQYYETDAVYSTVTEQGVETPGDVVFIEYVGINENFTNTIAWLNEHGYGSILNVTQ